MSYLHCHNCHFSQDDYWSANGWNPIDSFNGWKEYLFSEKIDEPFTNDSQFIKDNGNLTLREVLAREFEKRARWIRQMKYRTPEELKEKNPERLCPICHQKQLDED